jgi:hypothetical protein
MDAFPSFISIYSISGRTDDELEVSFGISSDGSAELIADVLW